MIEPSEYSRPVLARYGSFRDLTQVGITGTSDGLYICGTPCETLAETEERS